MGRKHRENAAEIARGHIHISGLVVVTEEGRIFTQSTWRERRVSGQKIKLGGKVRQVHRLVAQCWVDNPEGHCYVRHIDGSRTNNHARNLEWYSPTPPEGRLFTVNPASPQH